MACNLHLKEREDFDAVIQKQHGTSIFTPKDPSPIDVESNYESPDSPEAGMLDADDIPDFDKYVNADVLLPCDGEYLQSAQVTQCITDDHAHPVGDFYNNPLLDTRVYEVMFGNGSKQQFATNVIAENLWSGVDDDGYHHQMLDCILGHQSDDTTIKKCDEFYVSKSNQHTWNINIQWKDGSSSWKRLSDVKESIPVPLAEYSIKVGIAEEPAFALWVPYILKKRDQIVSAVDRRVAKRTHKCGIRILMTIQDAYWLDGSNKNTLWRNAIRKEMKNTSIAFDI